MLITYGQNLQYILSFQSTVKTEGLPNWFLYKERDQYSVPKWEREMSNMIK
jgi:hypothetical protein